MQIHPVKQKGSALITALFIMTLVAIAATATSTRLQIDIYHTRLSLSSDKLYLAAQAVNFWALGELAHPKKQFTRSDSTGKVLDFPVKLQAIYPNTQIKGALYDLQNRFNLNNVIDKKYQFNFQKFLENNVKKMEAAQRDQLALTLFTWLNPYKPGQEAIDNIEYYLKQKPPYYPAHQLMVHFSEFRLLMGVEARLYRSLEDFIVALPEKTPININTASQPVLRSLGFGLNNEQINELIAARGKNGIINLDQINSLLQKLNIRSEQVTIESQYFLAVARVSTEELTLINYSILKRQKDKKGMVTLSVISESLNSF